MILIIGRFTLFCYKTGWKPEDDNLGNYHVWESGSDFKTSSWKQYRYVWHFVTFGLTIRSKRK